MESKSKTLKVLAIALGLCLFSMIGASIVQTSGGRVEIKDMRWETATGHMMSALLFIPENATAENPAPGIVTSHGWYNNREMQDLNYVEWSRRGFVVISIDMYGHGHSDAVTPAEWSNAGTGMYDAVKLMSQLPYVDLNRIGITGHSNGARAANWTIKEDNLQDKALVSSVFLVANDAMYTTHPDEPRYTPFVKPETRSEYTNNYGTRDVGILAAQFDEFFFRTILEDGRRTVPGEYITTDYAQSFLKFGTDPAISGEKRESNIFYKKNIKGKSASRIIYNPYQIHPWNHISTESASYGIEYFEETLGAPNPISPTKQVWTIKLFFNFIGLIGLMMFIVAFTKFMLYTETFASLRAQGEVKAAPSLQKTGKIWFWGTSLFTSLVAYVAYLKSYNWTVATRPAFFPQRPPYFIGIWSSIMGIMVIIVLILTYKLYSKKKGLDLQEAGVIIGIRPLLKTIALALTVVVSAYGIVFLADYFFKVDFRMWVLTIRTFTPDKIAIALKYIPMFLLYYIPMSVAANSFNYFKIGKKEWMNTAIVAGFTALGPAIIVAVQYITFFKTGETYYSSVSNILGIWLFPILVVIPVAAIISRKIYRLTRNPYLPGIIMGIFITLMLVSNTLTELM